MVVNGDRENLLGLVLTDDIVIEELKDLLGLGELGRNHFFARAKLFLDDLVTQVDALIANVDPGAGDQLLDLLLGLTAKTALEQLGSVAEFCH